MSLTLLPAGLMLISAIAHAAIGVILKRAQDKLVFRAILAITSALIALPFIFVVPLPPANAWKYLIGGTVIHFIYQLSQISAFERGDMSLVYPIMRGVAPALAAIIAFFWLGETLGPRELLGLAIAVLALIGFGWPEKSKPANWGAAVSFALLCGVMIATYSVVDGAGMRLSRMNGAGVASYMVYFFLLDVSFLPALALIKRRGNIAPLFKQELKSGIIGGATSSVTYGLALIAFSLAPIAKMSAVRETSVVFGAFFAAYILKEPFGGRRIALALLLAFGLLLMQST
jgi:drug/metabolite transporter (DMT)-like permease